MIGKFYMGLFNLNYHHISLLDLSKYKEYDIFLISTNWILKKKIDLAYRLCCRFNAEIKDNPGLGCDWKTWWQKGLTPSLKEIYINILKDTPNHFVAACAIYLDFSGISSNQLRIFINQLYKSSDSLNITSIEQIRYIHSIISCERNFQSYKDANIASYIFTASLDLTTCSTCGLLDGKSFPISERKIGINCPPMHVGCRCTTTSDISATRTAWNSALHKWERIPYISYNEWYKKKT